MIIELLYFPALFLILGGLTLSVIPKNIRSIAFILFPLVALGALFSLPNGFTITYDFASYEITLVHIDSLNRVFAIIFTLIAVIGGIFAYHISDKTQQISALIYAGGALGVTFAGDWLTLFIFWEIMAVSSTFLIWAQKDRDSGDVGLRYLLVHIFGGGLLFAGILLHIAESGSILITALPNIYTLSSVLILLGVAVNAAVPPLHAWLADSYPKATITGSVFMSAFTTKSAIYVMIRVFPEWEILIWVGVFMALYGTVFALISNDIRQILAYSIISQLGYMVTAIGIGSEMAINGAVAHAFGHILYKSLLFMAAGAVIYSTGKSRLSELGGLAHKMKWVMVFYMIGAFSISGFPLFNGFISKTMIMSAIGDAHFEWVMLLFLVASVGSYLHSGLKIPYFTFFGNKRNTDMSIEEVPLNMKVAMGIGGVFCIAFGLFPDLIYGILPYSTSYRPYSVYHLVEMIQILVMGFIVFWFFKDKLNISFDVLLDTDWFYRKPATLVKDVSVYWVDQTFDKAELVILSIRKWTSVRFLNPMLWLNPFTNKKNKSSTYSPGIEIVLTFVLMLFVLFSIVYLFVDHK